MTCVSAVIRKNRGTNEYSLIRCMVEWPRHMSPICAWRHKQVHNYVTACFKWRLGKFNKITYVHIFSIHTTVKATKWSKTYNCEKCM